MREGLRVTIKKGTMYYYQCNGKIGVTGTSLARTNKSWWYIRFPGNRLLPYPVRDIVIVSFKHYMELCGKQEDIR